MNLHRICVNRTPMDVRAIPMDDRFGRDVLVVIAKMTWHVAPNGVATIGQPLSPVRLYDVPQIDHPLIPQVTLPPSVPRPRSVRYASDGVEEKPGTDVLLVGTCYPSRPDSTKETVSLRVETRKASLHKTLTVTGPRIWQAGLLGMTPGAPGKMSPTPLVYELAYGGVDATDPDAIVTEYRNPSGTGFLERRAELFGQPAPVIEDPKHPLSSRSPMPAGFGPIPAHWAPRSERIGTLDDQWRRERAPVRPVDFDPLHHACAPDDQRFDTPLVGDEAVEILGATPEGAWRFRLPRYAPVFHVTVRGITTSPDTHLDTYFIHADERRVELVWRIKVPLPRKTAHLENVHVFGSDPLPDRVMATLAASVFGGQKSAETL